MRPKKLLVLFACYLFLVSCNKNKLIVQGTVKNENPTTVQLYELKVYSQKLIDSTTIKANGTFKFKLEPKNASFYQLQSTEFPRITFIGHANSQVQLNIKTDSSYYTISGTPDNETLKTFYDTLNYHRGLIGTIQQNYISANDTLRLRLEEQYAQIIKKQKRYSLKILLNNLTSLLCIPVLYQELIDAQYLFDKSSDLQFFKLAYDSLSKYYPEQRQVKALGEDFENRMGNLNRIEILQKANVNYTELPDIKLPNQQGDSVSLFSLPAEYVLLLFWSYADNKSLVLAQEYKKVYAKYSNKKFDVYAVCANNSLENWQYATKIEELKWKNVIDTNFTRSTIRFIYNIHQLPASMLVKPASREILARDIEPIRLDSYLQDVLN